MTRSLASGGSLLAAGGSALWLALVAYAGPAPVTSRATVANISDGRLAMGTVLQITLVLDDPTRGRAILEELFDEAARLEGILTTWDPGSATSRLNREGARGEVEIPPELHGILEASQRAAVETGGVFDVTVGPLVALWRSAAERGALPSEHELAEARARVGAGGIRLAPCTARLPAGVAVDFGGIGKGWALDRLGELLLRRGVEHALLDFGGSSWLALGAPDGDSGWRVLVASRDGLREIVTLRDESLSVSESFGQWTEIEGRRFGHVIDPRSGWPVAHTALAAVRAASGETAEVWSTALLVWKPEEGMKRVRARPDLEALLLGAEGTRRTTRGFGATTALPSMKGLDLAPPR